jgi:murein DD-endopeptidase MepM/ murein hydrolase activator NlpD
MPALRPFGPCLVRLGVTLLSVAICLLLRGGAAAAAGDDVSGQHWVWPLSPRPAVIHAFDPPDVPYGSGHRGVDLAAAIGQSVFAIGDGAVTYAGPLAGRPVIVVSHGRLRSTYEPVSAGVAVGDRVRAGQQIGVLSVIGSHCLPEACLHLGVLRGTEYLDPLALLGSPPIRLKPMGGEPVRPVSWNSAVHDSVVSAAGYGWTAIR